jgi:hydrogenase assembly chaperone HypC/HupF
VCLSRPAEVLAVSGYRATVLLGSEQLEVDTSPVGRVAPGDHLLIHAGLALERVDRSLADELAGLLAELSAHSEEEHP